jgi:N-methylhydantoinase B
VTKSMAYTALRCLMPTHTSTNSGYMRPIKVIAEPGTVLNGVLPAAGAGRAATAYRLMDVIFGALAKALPDRIMAAGEGSPLMHTFFGLDEEKKPFVLVDLMRGSWGARPGADGLDATALACSTGSSVPAEIVELEHPVRLEYYGYVQDSGGAGRFRGGMAVLREYRALVDATLQYRSERRKFRPYGLHGGEPGSASIVIINPAGECRLLEEKGEIRMKKGDIIRFCQAGGGGYGDPLNRDPQQVWRDVRNELVSPEAALAKYGVVIDPATRTVDRDATERLRKSRRRPDSEAVKVEVVPVADADLAFMTTASSRIRSFA